MACPWQVHQVAVHHVGFVGLSRSTCAKDGDGRASQAAVAACATSQGADHLQLDALQAAQHSIQGVVEVGVCACCQLVHAWGGLGLLLAEGFAGMLLWCVISGELTPSGVLSAQCVKADGAAAASLSQDTHA